MKIVLSDPSLCIAMNELIEAITLTHHAPASCARCIERLRTIAAPHRTKTRLGAISLESSNLKRLLGVYN